MSRALVVIARTADREKLISWIQRAPWNTRVELKGPKRTLPQNDRMWAMLTDVATQVRHNGLRLSPDDWKLLFLDALKREVRLVPNLDGNGMVSLGRSSSDLDKEEMGDLMELIAAYGARHGVIFNEPAQLQAIASGRSTRRAA